MNTVGPKPFDTRLRAELKQKNHCKIELAHALGLHVRKLSLGSIKIKWCLEQQKWSRSLYNTGPVGV